MSLLQEGYFKKGHLSRKGGAIEFVSSKIVVKFTYSEALLTSNFH